MGQNHVRKEKGLTKSGRWQDGSDIILSLAPERGTQLKETRPAESDKHLLKAAS